MRPKGTCLHRNGITANLANLANLAILAILAILATPVHGVQRVWMFSLSGLDLLVPTAAEARMGAT